jgi:predicted 3-demethylubiquinone-9 3-methyltransferase (glyoxalase superfamily)
MPRITPFLWFDHQAEEAANFYVSLFKNSKVTNVSRYGDGAPRPKGTAMMVNLEIDGQQVIALNGGPEFKFTEAISFFVDCETPEEVDRLWNALTKDGEEGRCGWLKDKFGLSWQIVPRALGELMGDPDPVKSQQVMQAMLQMKKIDAVKLKQAYDGR